MNLSTFFLPTRIYWSHTDAAGIVYHGQYAALFEMARVEWMRQLGFGQADQGFFAVVTLNMNFVTPIMLDDLVHIGCEVTKVGASQLSLHQHITKQDLVTTRAQVDLAWLDAETRRPRRMPQSLRSQLLCES